MKRVKVEGGWDEVTTKKIRFERWAKKKFIKVEQWLDAPKKSCDFCKTPWTLKDKEEWTGLVATNKNNKVLCMDCWDYLEMDKHEKAFKVTAKLKQEEENPS